MQVRPARDAADSVLVGARHGEQLQRPRSHRGSIPVRRGYITSLTAARATVAAGVLLACGETCADSAEVHGARLRRNSKVGATRDKERERDAVGCAVAVGSRARRH